MTKNGKPSGVRIKAYDERRQERIVLASMFIDGGVLQSISKQWPQEGLFHERQANRIGKMAVRYYLKHEQAPGRNVGHTLLANLCEKQPDELLERYADALAQEIEKQDSNNPPTSFYKELANRHFNSVRALQMREIIDAGIGKDGEVSEEAIQKLEQLNKNKVQLGSRQGVWILEDDEIKASAEDDVYVLIEYPDDLGIFFGQNFRRDGFVAFAAPMKRGKSFWLQDIAWRAVQQQRKTLYIVVGDMSKSDVKRRLRQRIAARPAKPGIVNIPVSISVDYRKKGASANVRCKQKKYTAEQTVSDETVIRRLAKTIEDRRGLQLLSVPSHRINAADIEEHLHGLVQEGWIADVVVIDYADNLSPMPGTHQARDDLQIAATWSQLRAISQIFNCLVVTATQVKAAGYGDRDRISLLGPEHFSGSRTKNDHVTAMFGINQSLDEKKKNLVRLNSLEQRHEADPPIVYVAGCPQLSNPAMVSLLES